MLGLFKRKPVEHFDDAGKQLIVAAIQDAERRTSGEVRVYVESRCRFVDPLMRAVELFALLKMNETAERNAVLVYVAMKDRQMAVFGDEGIHSKVGSAFWNQEIGKMMQQFSGQHYAEGIAQIVRDIGEALVQHFPFDHAVDKNELPDDIIFGR